jgi:hypothetical protein
VSHETSTIAKRPLHAHVLALLAAFAVVVATTALWIVALRLGPPLDGFVAGPMIVFVPLFLLVTTGLWIAVRAVLHGRVRWHAITVAVAAAALSFAIAVVYCGPSACFTGGTHGLMGWFVAIGTTLAALAHHYVLELTTGDRAHAV